MRQRFDYLILGGGIAGTSAAETIRMRDADCSIGIITEDPYRLHSRIMISKPAYFNRKIPANSIWLKSEEWYKENRIALLTNTKIIALDAQTKTVTTENGKTLKYGKLLIATGTQARKWPLAGAATNVFYLRTLDQGRALQTAAGTAKTAVTIGGGFVSLEAAEALSAAGVSVTMLIRDNYYWKGALNETSGKMVEDVLRAKGIVMIKNVDIVQTVIENNRIAKLVLSNGQTISCDIVVCGIGTESNVSFLEKSWVKKNKGVLTNEYLETSAPDVWAAGDVAEIKDLLLEEQIQFGNWINAQQQGIRAGENMLGDKKPYMFVSFYTAQIFGLAISFVGDARSENRTVLVRAEPEKNSLAQIIVDEKNELVGATLINRTQDLPALLALIKNNVRVAGKEQQISNPTFDLKNLL